MNELSEREERVEYLLAQGRAVEAVEAATSLA